MALDRLIDSLAEDERRDWMAQIIQMKRNLQTPLQYDSYYGFAGDILQIITEDSGVKIVSGNVTQASTASSITVQTGESALPFLAVIEKIQPVYGENGANLCMYAKLPLFLDMNQPAWLESNGYLSVVGESRTTFSNYCSAFANSLINTTDPFSSGIIFRCRSNQYPFFAGAYRWYALYGEVFQ